MKRIGLYEIKKLAITNIRGARVQVKDVYLNKRKSESYDYEIGDILKQGKMMLEKEGHEILGYSEGKNCYYIMTNVL